MHYLQLQVYTVLRARMISAAKTEQTHQVRAFNRLKRLSGARRFAFFAETDHDA